MYHAGAALALLAAALLTTLLSPHPQADSAGVQSHAVQPAPMPVSTLFPGLNESAITSITVAAPDRSFHFLCDNHSLVSVNGSQADSEIFLTLLEQIADLPVDESRAFLPEKQDLLLTLTVSSGPSQRVARFYADGKHGEIAHIVAGTAEAPEYRTTGGWRVGALMMTCEGTRIQDAHGNEIPVNK